MNSTNPNADGGALAHWELMSTVLLSGAVVMVVEIVGTRIIGPVFGVSLFVWAALLSVTLCALALGYYVGGVLIDRTPRITRLGGALLVGGVALGVVPLVAPTVLRGTSGFGPRGGPLLAALVLFAPALIALGTTGPIAVRLATTDVAGAGRRVGSVYAVSTAGSLIGTLITSFWLIPAFDTNAIVLGGAAVLLTLAAAILFRRGKLWAGAFFGVLLLPWLGFPPSPQLPPNIQVLSRTRSLYGLVEVIDDTARGLRYMRSDHSIIGVHWIRDQTAAFAFLHALEVLPFLRPNAKDLLVIGLGTGALPSALSKAGMRADVVEIDPAVVRYAQEHFGFEPTGEMHVEDARTFIQTASKKYDIIVHDTFTGGATPDHLLSAEVLRRLHELLRPGGVLALNMVGFQRGPHADATWAVARTMRSEFPLVRAFRDSPLDHRPDESANIIFFASDDALDFDIPRLAQFNDAVCAKMLPVLREWEVLQNVPPGDIITDAHNPLGRMQLAVAEDHYHAMGKLLPIEVWIR